MEALQHCNELRFSKTQRGRSMLVYEGYRYVENRQSGKNIFWRCSRYVKYSCKATVTTSKNPNNVSIRLGSLHHTHPHETKADDDVTMIDEIILKENKLKN